MDPALPTMTIYHYWKEKRAFQLAEDTYGEWVLFAVERGAFRYRMGTMQGIATGGDWVVCPPGLRFEREAIEPLDFHFIGFVYPDDAHPAGTGSDQEGFPRGCLRLPPRERMLEDYAMLKREDWRDPAIRDAYRQHAFRDLWFMLLESVEGRRREDAAPAPDPAIRQAAERLQASIAEPLSLKRIAADLGLSPVQLTRRFQAAYQVNPLQYVTSLRMRKACALLVETDWTLDMIAERCGYENGFYLSRVFSRSMGKSPSQYRKEHRM